MDKSYFDKVTNALNEQFKENKNEKIASLVEEDLNELIQMLEEKRMKRKQKDDFEM